MGFIASRLLTSLALAGTCLAGIGQADAAVSIPIVAPLERNEFLFEFQLRRDRPGPVNDARNAVNSLMHIPYIGPIGYFDLDGAMWSRYHFWIRGDSMGTRATVGAWGNLYTDMAGIQKWWLHGHFVAAQAWVFRDPYYDPTMACVGCASSPWRAEALVERETTNSGISRLILGSAPASIVRDVSESMVPPTPIVKEDFSRNFAGLGSLRIWADASFVLNAKGKLSASLAGVVTELDGTAESKVSLTAFGMGYNWVAYANARVDLLANTESDVNNDGLVNEADVSGNNPTPRAARAHTRVALGERRLSFDDPAHPKPQICARVDGDLWIANALRGSVGYNLAFYVNGSMVHNPWNYNEFGGIGLHPYAPPLERCADLAAPF